MPELVALQGPPGPAWVDGLSRCWDAGDAVLPVDHRLPPAAVHALYDTLGPTVVAEVGGGRRHVAGGRPTDDGDALVLATSGTTGAPRGVVLTHAAVGAAARMTSAAVGADPASDTWLCCLPLAHAGGLGVVTRALLTGTPLRVLPGFDAAAVTAEAGALADDGRDVLVSLVATALRRIDPGLFRVVLLGGDAPPRWTEGRPAAVVVTYGMTESGGGCVYDGRPLEPMEVRLGEGGQILLRGPALGRAYRGRHGDTALTDAGGWYATGDGGRWEADGRLAVDGRLAEVIVTGGEKVWPTATEAVLAQVPGVAEVAVIGRPDPEWGARVVAVVVPSDSGRPPALDALRALATELIGPWAAPKELELVTSLPRTALGKVRRAELR